MKLTDLQPLQENKVFALALTQAVRKLDAEAAKAEQPHIKMMLDVESDLLKKVAAAVADGNLMKAKNLWKNVSRQTRAHVPAVASKSFEAA